MKYLLLLVCLLLAACQTQPDLPAGPPLGEAAARHLLVRTGFNAPPEAIARYARMSAARAAFTLLNENSAPAKTTPPGWATQWDFEPNGNLSAEERRDRNRLLQERGQELKSWWFQEMLTTRSPLAERMALFWHNHFTSSLAKVRVPQLMFQQQQLLREQALGNFGTLLAAISRDPAMLVYLDGNRNVLGSPNENYAREVMELFTLGEGHYSESDIREAARAFTGWSVEMKTGQFANRPRQHDNGNKTIFGQTGNFNGDDVIRILLAQPATGEFIVGKLWREFISASPDQTEVRRLAGIFRSANYEIRPLLQALLTTPAFYADENRGQLIRSPAELIIGTLRTFALQPDNWKPFVNTSRQMGQDILNPPNVKGWPGGEWWINSQTLAVRQQFASRLLRADGRGNTGLEPDYGGWLAHCDIRCSTLALLPLTPERQPSGTAPDVIRQLLADPRYQLK